MATNDKIAVSYKLYASREGQENWDLVEETRQGEPFEFVSGMGMVLKDFEVQLADVAENGEFDFKLSPEQAYGPRIEEAVQQLPREIFEIEGRLDERYIYVDAIVPLQNADGERFNAVVTEITDEHITVDLNHPMAGLTLHFVGRVEKKQPASAADMQEAAKQLTGGCSGCSGCGDSGECGGGCDSGQCGSGCGNCGK